MCVVCLEVLAHNSFKKEKLSRHLTTKLLNKELDYFEDQLKRVEQQQTITLVKGG